MQQLAPMKCNVIKFFITIYLFLSICAHAQVDRVLLIQALQEELIVRGDQQESEVTQNPEKRNPETITKQEPTPQPMQEMSRGEKIIEEQKRKVREQLALKKNNTPNLAKTIFQEHKEWFSQLKSDHQETIKQWKELNRQFVKRIPQIKKNLEDSSVFKNVKKISKQDLIQKNINQPTANVLVDDAILKVKVKDQGDRPTCSAFAGTVLIESLLQKNNINQSLSPEYVYFASKPDCQKSPCATVGSWIGYGFEYSQKKSSPDIPTLDDCNYSNSAQTSNQTNLPLKSSCSNGLVQIKKFRYLTTMQQAYAEIQGGKSVFVSLKLSENFYDNQGIIYLTEASKGNTPLDQHSKGHAVVIVGIMPLPKKVIASEGAFCWIIKNSWGQGWGRGGYACLSEKWLNQHRGTNPMLVLDQINHKNYGILQ